MEERKQARQRGQFADKQKAARCPPDNLADSGWPWSGETHSSSHFLQICISESPFLGGVGVGSLPCHFLDGCCVEMTSLTPRGDPGYLRPGPRSPDGPRSASSLGGLSRDDIILCHLEKIAQGEPKHLSVLPKTFFASRNILTFKKRCYHEYKLLFSSIFEKNKIFLLQFVRFGKGAGAWSPAPLLFVLSL